jgi:hypothetical protein
MASSVFSAASPFDAPKKRQPYNPVTRVILKKALTWDDPTATATTTPKVGDQRASLGVSFPSESPGAVLGYTYYEYQANNYQGRMVRAGRNYDVSTLSDSLPLIHFVWMNAPTAILGSGHRGPSYSYYDAAAGAYQPEVEMTFDPQRSGYFNMDVSKGNRPVVVGHYNPTGDVTDYHPYLWYDASPGNQGFAQKIQIPDALTTWENPYTGDAGNVIWPHVAFQDGPNAGEHVTHVAAVTVGGSQVLYYFRKVGNTSNYTLGQLSSCADPLIASGWDCPYVPDTVQSTVAGVEASKQSGKVALFYTTNLPAIGDPCDTCSQNNSLGGARDAWENDMYYQVSTNYGASWGNTKNVTHNVAATADWMPYNDMDGMWDSNDEFHIAWVGLNWARYRLEGNPGFGCRIFHWKESFGNEEINSGDARTAMQLIQDPTDCNGNPFNLNYGKINLAECNNNLYISAVDLWDGHTSPLFTDCSYRGYNNSPGGSVNGEVVVVISDDFGTTFDLPHNLTNSPDPECDSVDGAVGPCDAEHWPSMIPRGFPTRTLENWTGVTSIIPLKTPPASYPDGPGVNWLHMQYVQDLDPGSVLFSDGSIARDNPLRHIRIACVTPDEVPNVLYSIAEIGWPTYVKPGQNKNISIVLENIGNATTSMTVTDDEITGPANWLDVSGVNGSVGEGLLNKDTITVNLDATGLTQEKINEAGGTSIVFGELWFDHQGPSDIDTMDVVMIVTDTILLPNWDTISTGVISLQVGTNGQFGGGGNKAVSMDYWKDGVDCDTIDSIPGNTEVYVYDGSYVVGGVGVGSGLATDTNLSHQLYNVGPRTPSSVYQTTPQSSNVVTSGIMQTWNSGKSVNSDTSLAFAMRWIAPQVTATYGTAANKTWHSDQQFIVRELKIWSADGAAHNDLAIGDIIDWDVPGDSGVAGNNTGDTSTTNSAIPLLRRNLLYQRGSEYNQDPEECQDNDTRFAGVSFAFIRAYWNHDNNTTTAKQWTIRDSVGYGGFIDANAHLNTPLAADHFANMAANTGYHKWSHTDPDSARLDLHSALTAAFNYDLGGLQVTPAQKEDTVVVYTVYATVLEDLSGPARIQQLADRGRNFATYFGCCVGIRGDVDGNGTEATIIDLNFAVNKIFRNGLKSTCQGEADIDSNKDPLTILDLNFLVNKVFRAGPLPASCGAAL